jgi:DNA-binding PadR family transcriptional regulator
MPDGESLHGYAIMQAVAEMTQGRETILPGTLYAALARMVDEGLVETQDAPDGDPSGGPARRYYRRTSFGRAVARAESERLRALLDIAVAQRIIGHKK